MKIRFHLLLAILATALLAYGCEKAPIAGLPHGKRAPTPSERAQEAPPPPAVKVTPVPTPVPSPPPRSTPWPTPTPAPSVEAWRVNIADPGKPWADKTVAAYADIEKLWAGADYAGALRVLHELYAVAPGQPQRVELEKSFMGELRNYPLDVLTELSGQTLPPLTDEEKRTFPYLHLRYETAAKRLARSSGPTTEAASAQLKDAVENGHWADPSIPALMVLPSEGGGSGPALRAAMFLPLTGAYSDVGWKVARGVWAAQRVMAVSSGHRVEIEIVNTDFPRWQEALNQLGRDVVLVGGPLQINVWKAILDSGANKSRAFFTFLPDLGTAQEGVQAWRFLGGPKDQARSLAETAADTLGVKRVAIFHPRDKYGARMAQLFSDAVIARNMTIAGLGAYRQDDPSRWGQNVAEFLKVPVRVDKKNPVRTKLNAEVLFLPNTWSEAAQLVPQFYYYDSGDMLFFGPGLWGQHLPKERVVEERYYHNAITPTAYWPEADTPGAVLLRKTFEQARLGEADFWCALGFDFARFVRAVGPLPGNVQAAALNRRLTEYKGLDFSQAPLVWDNAGHVSQRFYLMRPAAQGGLAPVDVQELRKTLEAWRAKKK